jgi:hypothetical protein
MAAKTKSTTKIPEAGSGFRAKPEYRSYFFHKLKRRGDYFVVKDLTAEGSIRVQATRQSKKRGVKYRVAKTIEEQYAGKARKPVLVVFHNGNIP